MARCGSKNGNNNHQKKNNLVEETGLRAQLCEFFMFNNQHKVPGGDPRRYVVLNEEKNMLFEHE